MENVLERIKGTVVVSVQAMPSEPLYHERCMAAMMKSALNGGAGGLRVAGVRDIENAKKLSKVPVIGITKPEKIPANYKEIVYITPTIKDVLDVIRFHLGPSKRSEDERRKHSDVWSSPLFSVLHVADHMDAGFVHCDDRGNLGAESFISLDCSALYNNGEFKQLLKDIGRLALKYNIQLKQNKYRHTEWNKKRCSLRILEFGEKPWADLVPLTAACRSISRNIRECGITLSKISINKNNLVLVAETDVSLTTYRDNLQNQFKQHNHSSTNTENLTVKIAEISNNTGDTAKFLADLNQSFHRIKINVDALNLHYYKGIVAGLYYFKK